MGTAVYLSHDNTEWKYKLIKQLLLELHGEPETSVYLSAEGEIERGMELQAASLSSLQREEQQEEVGHQFFQIGDSVVAYTNPSLEGIIVGIKNVEDRRMELMLLVAPYQKKGQAWNKATVCFKDAMKLSKRFPAKFAFPIENSERIRAEAKTADAYPIWITSVLAELIASCVTEERQEPRDTHSTRSTALQPTIMVEAMDARREKRNTELSLLDNKLEVLEKKMVEVILLKDGGKKKKKDNNSTEDSEAKDLDDSSHKKRECKKRSRKRKSRRRYDSSSSDKSLSKSSQLSLTSSEESDLRGEVREKGKLGMFHCPFATTDNRGYKKGQTAARKIIRTALHNLYSEYHIMDALATAIVTLANASAFKPFSTNIAWLYQYAKYLDRALLNAVNGPWALWNEAWLDDVVFVFLEFLVRISAIKECPTCLDDKVRKWMRKRKVGINPKYGPVPQFMQHAKLTDNRLLLLQGPRNTTRDKSSKLATATSHGKTTGPGPVSEQKKA